MDRSAGKKYLPAWSIRSVWRQSFGCTPAAKREAFKKNNAPPLVLGREEPPTSFSTSHRFLRTWKCSMDGKCPVFKAVSLPIDRGCRREYL